MKGKFKVQNESRQNASEKLVGYMAKLFVEMLLTNRKYVNPSSVLKGLVDDFGNPILLGQQKDIAEINLNLLERIEEGLWEH